MEGQLITTQLQRLEETLYQSAYATQVQTLANTEATPANQHAPAKLLQLIGNTSCQLCRDRAIAAINQFGQQLEAEQLRLANTRYDSLHRAVEPWIFMAMEQTQAIEQQISPADSTKQSELFLRNKLAETKRDLGNLHQLLQQNTAELNLIKMQMLIKKVQDYQRRVVNQLALICSLKPETCK